MMLLILDQPFGSAEKQGGGITEASIAVWQSAARQTLRLSMGRNCVADNGELL
jgi:hypothetical protein